VFCRVLSRSTGAHLSEKRSNRGGVWFARASVNKQQIQKGMGSDSLSLAQQVAEDWYLGLRGKSHAGLRTISLPGGLIRGVKQGYADQTAKGGQ